MSQKDATVIAREIQDMAQAMAESMTGVAETVKAAVAVTHGQARGEAGQIVQLSTPAPVLQLPPPSDRRRSVVPSPSRSPTCSQPPPVR